MVTDADRKAATELDRVRYKGGHASLPILAAHRELGRAEMLAEVVETVRGMPLHAIASGYIDIADALQAKFGKV